MLPPQTLSLAIIDDNHGSLEMMESALRMEGLSIHCFSDPDEGLDFILNHHPQVVLTDLVMPGRSGLDVVDRVVEFDPSIDIVLMTAHYSSESAVEAIRRGASDYLDKPISIQTLRDRVTKLLDRHRARLVATQLERDLAANAVFEGMVGNSPRMWDLASRIQRVAAHYRSVLVTGQTGTGKELVARALHRLSPVGSGPLVPLNCSALVETLFESELFGHVRGAFTGATQDKVGLFEHANNGTLFLDEIGDMPLGTQAKLLRALQNHEVQRLGSLQPRKVNVRVVAATHRDLRALIAEGRFREDLFYRLSMIELTVPSLLDRDGDLPLLVRHFVQHFARQYNKPVRGLTTRAQLVLQRHTWPGNVREVENVIGHACIMVVGSMIDVPDLPAYLLRGDGASALAPAPVVLGAPTAAVALPALEEQEKRLLTEALQQTAGNQSSAARLLRISRDTLRYRMKKHGLN